MRSPMPSMRPAQSTLGGGSAGGSAPAASGSYRSSWYLSDDEPQLITSTHIASTAPARAACDAEL